MIVRDLKFFGARNFADSSNQLEVLGGQARGAFDIARRRDKSSRRETALDDGGIESLPFHLTFNDATGSDYSRPQGKAQEDTSTTADIL